MFEQAQPSQPASPSLSSKLLVVADDPSSRDVLSRRLARRGYAIDVAENGPDALEKIQRAQYDLVLMEIDQLQPDMSGLDLLRLLRATHSQSELPVIMVTAEDNPQSAVEALGHGANDQVSLPLDLPVVAARIQAQLERSRAERHVNTLDPLTRVSSRRFLLDRLNRIQDCEPQDGPGQAALLLIDLDGFKMFNDSFGFAAGDCVLIETARRLQSALADATALQKIGICGSPLLARVGGAAFAVLLDSAADAARADALAQLLVRCLRPPFELPETAPGSAPRISMTAHLGIAVLAGGHATAAELLRDAGLAMSLSRQNTANGDGSFDPETERRALFRLALARDLRHAIERDQLVVFYQPKVRLDNRAVIGFEALVRWRHPQFGLIPPNDFIPIAEETGLIVALGSWVLRQACMQLKSWHAKYPSSSPLSMNVNLSVKQLADRGLVEEVEAILRETGIPPESLKLELTESTLVLEIESAREVLSRLQALQIGLKLDDFGTGYSSLSYLRTLHFDSLKIDRSFVHRLELDGSSAAIVEAIVNLAHTLHMTVVAEGIENEQQLAKLLELGCTTGQGFLFSRPVAAASAERLLAPPVAA